MDEDIAFFAWLESWMVKAAFRVFYLPSSSIIDSDHGIITQALSDAALLPSANLPWDELLLFRQTHHSVVITIEVNTLCTLGTTYIVSGVQNRGKSKKNCALKSFQKSSNYVDFCFALQDFL